MTNKIPEDKIEEIRQANNVVDVVSEYVQLKKQGRNHFGLCPFHDENTPSFSVTEEKQIFHCFGCGKGGNVFSFIMEIENLNFVDAVRYLAKESQIDLPEIEVSQTNALSSESSTLLSAYEWLTKYYNHLLKYTEDGEEALTYFTSRGITEEMVDVFQLGYAPSDAKVTVDFLLKKDFHQQLLVKSGVLSMREDNVTDPFRGRIVFPINNHLGRTVGFGGRAISEGQQPKYLNSPENELFHKGNLLYNFDLAKNEIRKKSEVIVLEGYMDVISTYQAGFKNVVATLGTALSENQARLLKRYVDTVIICFDGDSAGIEASYQAAKILRKNGCDVKIARVPNESDPDQFILDNGAEAFQNQVIDQSQTFTKFYMDYKQRSYDLTIESNRIEYIDNIVKHISQIQSPIERELYISELSNMFEISAETITSEVNKLLVNIPEEIPYQNTINTFSRPQINKPRNYTRQAFENAERYLIAHLLQNNFTSKIQNEVGINFNLDVHKILVTHIYALLEQYDSIEVSQLLDKITDDYLIEVITDIALISINDNITEAEINDYINTINNHATNKPELDKLKDDLKQAEQEKNSKLAAEIAVKIIQFRKKK